jgi:hypothetical protein
MSGWSVHPEGMIVTEPSVPQRWKHQDGTGGDKRLFTAEVVICSDAEPGRKLVQATATYALS